MLVKQEATIMHLLLAHAFGQRYELPIPLALFVFAGAGVVLLSFFLVINRSVKRAPKTLAVDEPPLTKLGPISSTLSLLGLAGLIAAGFMGSQEIPENILPTFFWVIVWVGVALSCGLLGDWTGRLNPFANLTKITAQSPWRKAILGRAEPFEWGPRVGWWPAVALFFAIVSCELIFNQSMTVPANMATGLLAYAVTSAFLGLIFGTEWLKKGEVFTVLFNTWGRLGYFRFGGAGHQGFLGGLDEPFSSDSSRVVFVILLLASVSFDGLLSTPLWSSFQHGLPLASASGGVYESIQLGAFILVAGLLLGLFTGFAVAVSRAGGRRSTPLQSLAGLLPSLLPISFGYLLAHYLQYLLINGQLMFPLIGNPVGTDWWPVHLPFPFNDNFEPYTHILPTATAWYIAVAVIVAVHILAVVLAHRHLGGTANSEAEARRSEYPWIAAMVAYTMLSLWLLAQPLVKESGATSHAAALVQVAGIQ
jgi:hypothetical protein